MMACRYFRHRGSFSATACVICVLLSTASVQGGDAVPATEQPNGFHSLRAVLPVQTLPKRQEFSLFLVQRRKEKWSQAQKRHLLENFLRNSDGTFSGAMWASPSEGRLPGTLGPDDLGEANYRFHWVRDSALAMSTVLDMLESNDLPAKERKDLEQLARAFTSFSRQSQQIPLEHDWLLYTSDGHQIWGKEPPGPGAVSTRYGEAKYRVVKKDLGNGAFLWVPEAFNEPWGRPQNDGPALRASAISRILQYFLNKEDRGKTLNEGLEALREDVEYTKSAWRRRSVDPWEEVEGDHFFTRVVQSEALEQAIEVFKRLGLPTEALKEERAALEASLDEFWDPSKGYIVSSRNINRSASAPKKPVLDIAVLLAAARRKRGAYSASDPKVLSTAAALLDAFEKEAPPTAQGLPGVAIGRYPEDPWNGHDRVAKEDGTPVTHGHPWVLATLTMGEIFHQAAHQIEENKRLEINPKNHSFFQFVLGGALPPGVALAVNSNQSVVFDKEQNPGEYQDLLHRLVARGASFSARLFVSGVPLNATTHEQFTGVPDGTDRQVGPAGLGWNCAKAWEALRSATRAFTLISP